MTTQTQPTLSFPRSIFAALSPHPYLLAHLSPSSPSTPSTRANSRLPDSFRTPHINTGSLTHAEGSTVVRIGDTAVVCGVRAEILLASDVPNYRSSASINTARTSEEKKSYNEAKELDLLVPNIELATGCSPNFLPGQPPSTLAQSLSTRIYSLLHTSRLVDSEDLRIWYQPPNFSSGEKMDADHEDEEQGEEEEDERKPEIKAFWTLYIDILFISLDGNPFDAAWAAVVSALGNVRLPKAWWDADREMVLCSDEVQESKKLALRGCPVAVTAVIFKAKEAGSGGGSGGEKKEREWLLVDPDAFEEGLCDESVTVVVDCEEGNWTDQTNILGIEKVGGTAVGRQEIRRIAELAEGRWRQLKPLLRGRV